MESVNTPWKKEKWFTSPWNFEPNVIKDFKFTKSIDIHDITLKDGVKYLLILS